jgi:hypothetical protein
MYLFKKDGRTIESGLVRLEQLLQALAPGDPVIIMAPYGSRAEPLHHELKDAMTTVDDAVARIVDYVKALPKAAQGLDYRLFTLNNLSDPDAYLDQIRTKARKLNADTIEQVDKEDRTRRSDPLFALVDRLKEVSNSMPVQLKVTVDKKMLLAVHLNKGQAREVSPRPEKKRRAASN